MQARARSGIEQGSIKHRGQLRAMPLHKMAPRPLMIGGAWRDAWSDPTGSFRAARAANPVYALYGSEGMTQTSLGDFQPDADIAQFMRRGLHGVRPGDWRAFLAFLDAHFEPERRPAQ